VNSVSKPLLQYGVTLAAVAAAVVVRWLLDPLLGDHLPFATFFVAVVIAAWVGGLRPALLATVLGFLLSLYFFVPPRYSIMLPTGPRLVGLATYFMVSLIIAGFGEAMRVTQQRFAVQAERLRTTLASIGDAVITTDMAGCITTMNAVAEQLTGWTNAEAAGQSLDAVFQIVNEATRQPVENPALRALKEGILVGLANHTVLIAKDRKERHIHDSAAPIRCREGELVGCVLVFRDISDQHRQEAELRGREQALRDSEQRMRLATEATAVGIWEWNVVTDEIRWDPVMFQIYGIGTTPSGVVQYRDWSESVLPEDLRLQEEVLQDTVRRAGNSRREFRIRRRNDGECRHLEAVETVRTNEAGRAEWVVGTNLDVTDRKRAEEALRKRTEQLAEAEARIRSVMNNVINGIVTIDERGVVESFNSAAERLFGYQTKEVVGQNVKMLMGEPYHSEHDGYLANYLRTGQAKVIGIGREVEARRKDGSAFLMDLGISEFLLGERRYFTAVVRDITERKRLEEELRQLAADLSEADRRKDEFLATLAHELRNPLAPIRNGLQLIKLAGGQEAIVEQARSMMERQLMQMVRLVDDLMDVSRISRGKLELRKERVPLAAVLNSALETSRPLIEKMGHELTVTLPKQPLIVEADLTRLAQVFLNLLNNAAKYGDRGGHIQLNVERQGSDVVVMVKDNGIGIAADQLPRIFEMFTQVDRSLEKSQGGLGIGLTLVKRLVEMHGGRVEARSEGPGKGSEFIVRLPVVVEASIPQASGVEDEPAAPKSSLRILIVDDNRDGADSLAMMLRIMGNYTRTAYDGQEGADLAGEFLPDVMLLDIGLPKLNGYEVCRYIREQSWGKSVVLIAVTGWGQDDDRRRSHEAGFDSHMVKPVDPQALMKTLTMLAEAADK